MKRLLIIGAGGHGRAVAEAVALGNEYLVTAFLDDAPQSISSVDGFPVWGSIRELAACKGRVDAVLVAIGRNELRRQLHASVEAASLVLAKVVHPRAIVSPSASLGAGCVVMAGAVIGTHAHLGEGAIVNCGAVVDHDCRVECFGHLGVGACMAGGAVLGEEGWMQAGSSLGYGAKLQAGRTLQPGVGIAAC